MFCASTSRLRLFCLSLALMNGGPGLGHCLAPSEAGPVAAGGRISIAGPGQCQFCHAQQAEVRLSSPTVGLAFDVHARQGLGCADCHGGDPLATERDRAHTAAAGFVGRPDPAAIPVLCARCHSNPAFMVTYNPGLPVDQWEKYKTSRHGQLLEMGVLKVAQCVSCHTAHNVRPAHDPESSVSPANIPRTCAHCHGDSKYMAGFGIPTDQFDKYRASVHGVALLEKGNLGAPACNGCHGNHGAVPPGVQSLAHVCGVCHAINRDMFEKSPHAKVFAIQEIAPCTVCHGYHGITPPTARTFDMEADSVCVTCHVQDDAGWKAGKAMYGQVTELLELRTKAETLLDQAEMLGMDVSDGRFLMRDFRTSFFQLRTLSHELDLNAYAAKAKEARDQLTKAVQVAHAAIDEFYFRRKGLWVSLLLAIPLLLLLYLKVRALDVNRAASGRPAPEE